MIEHMHEFRAEQLSFFENAACALFQRIANPCGRCKAGNNHNRCVIIKNLDPANSGGAKGFAQIGIGQPPYSSPC